MPPSTYCYCFSLWYLDIIFCNNFTVMHSDRWSWTGHGFINLIIFSWVLLFPWFDGDKQSSYSHQKLQKSQPDIILHRSMNLQFRIQSSVSVFSTLHIHHLQHIKSLAQIPVEQEYQIQKRKTNNLKMKKKKKKMCKKQKHCIWERNKSRWVSYMWKLKIWQKTARWINCMLNNTSEDWAMVTMATGYEYFLAWFFEKGKQSSFHTTIAHTQWIAIISRWWIGSYCWWPMSACV